MRRLTSIAEVRSAVADARRAGRRVAFVPTMGYLHEGHLRLVDAARAAADVVVMSIFVNPLQFGPSEDLTRYPRDPEGDAAKAEARGVDLLFMPEVAEMYPAAPRVQVVPGPLAERWEGAARPGHFTGVLTVVLKLLAIVTPDVVVFGQKDAQQGVLVRAMCEDLNLGVRVQVEPTVRDPDGLALSSRNAYLSPEERARALVLSRALHAIRQRYEAGERDPERLLDVARQVLATEPDVRVEYVGLADPRNLEPLARPAADGDLAMIAARVGSTRLIDNVILGAA